MECLGIKDGHRLYYDKKHDEYLLLTPSFKLTRTFGHRNAAVASWAYDIKIKHRVSLGLYPEDEENERSNKE